MTTMETEIRTRLDQLFQKATLSTQLTELKEELMADLLEFTKDNLNEGMDESQAIEVAFQQLGSVDELIKEINENEAEDFSEDSTKTDDHYVKWGKLEINDDQIKLGDKTIIDDDKVDFGKFLKVDDEKVNLFNGFIDVDGDHVKIAGMDASEINFAGHLELANSQQFDLNEVKMVNIMYRNAEVLVTKSKTDQLVIKEYMSRQNERYNLQADAYDDQLDIREGVRPRLHWLKVRIEIQIPSSYDGTVSVTNHSGNLQVNGVINQKLNFNLKNTSGNIRLNGLSVKHLNVYGHSGNIVGQSVKAEQVSVDAHSGIIKFNGLAGVTKVRANSGSIKIDEFFGQADIDAKSGTIRLNANQLIGNSNIEAHSGSVKINLGSSVVTQFELTTNSGIVRVSGQANVDRSGMGFAFGTIGGATETTLRANTYSGNVRLSKA